MLELNNLKNATRGRKQCRRVGRGPGSGRGKTSGRGEKGAGSRSGYKRRYGYEGGQLRIFCKLPHRGFTRGRFITPSMILNLDDIEYYFSDGETVSLSTLYEKGLIQKKVTGGLKILGNGEITKKVTIEANAFSKTAQQKLSDKKINFRVI